MLPWGSFPRGLRRHFIAQNGRCPYCGVTLSLRQLIQNNEQHKKMIGVPSLDHVKPRSRGGRNEVWNKVVSCARCNANKKNRMPRPCETLFAYVTAEIFFALLPAELVGGYIPRPPKPKRVEPTPQKRKRRRYEPPDRTPF